MLPLLVLLAACGPKSPLSHLDKGSFLGTWHDEGGAEYVIVEQDKGPWLQSLTDTDGEAFAIQNVTAEGPQMIWTYLVPSTSYIVTMKMSPAGDDRLCGTWENQYDSGTECMDRVSK
ncbi:MAG: hypothetical protein H6742_13840 [Alphaproteobacteria bacterium]|nr:hypothetical protein [Alphaproteobacteria bacterium]